MMKTQDLLRNAPIHVFLVVTSFLLIIVPVMNKTPSYQISEKTVHAASQFLFLVDTEEYAKSWDVSSATLKKMLTQETWRERIAKIRTSVGQIVERYQHKITYTDTASDVSSGKYVIVTFLSKFELRDRVTETVTLHLDDNDQWQVVGYFIS